ncbi:MAG: hypothetical protein MI702_10765, partial [Chlorobiales bacterium]|nr:hypothetical protein [Chlorobiales bacterium]
MKVAIIDQQLFTEHEEYQEQLSSYREVGLEGQRLSTHGSAVASILCGKRCGVAPEVELFYWATPSWKRDYKYATIALEEIIAYNRGHEDKILLVSISQSLHQGHENLSQWQDKIREATEQGIHVQYVGRNTIGVGTRNFDNKNSFSSYRMAYRYNRKYDSLIHGFLMVPVDNRTYASPEGVSVYTFASKGGWSWT